MIFAWFNPVCKISKLNKFKMDLNSRDIWKPKLASCSKEILFPFCQNDSSEMHVTDPLRWAMCYIASRRLQHDSTRSTEIHQTVHVSAELRASEGTSPEWLVSTLNAATAEQMCVLWHRQCEHLAIHNTSGMRKHQRSKPKYPSSLQK